MSVPSSGSKPIIFFVFANDLKNPGNFLTELKPEQRDLDLLFNRSDLPVELSGIHRFSTYTNIQELVEDLNHYSNQIIIFHFSGHSKGLNIFIEDSSSSNVKVSGNSLQAFLREEKNLKLVFLNGCANKEIVNSLIKTKIDVIIATNGQISDSDARSFSKTFYESFIKGKTLQTAFESAKGIIRNDENRTYPKRGFEIDDNDNSEIPWGLYYKNKKILKKKIHDFLHITSPHFPYSNPSINPQFKFDESHPIPEEVFEQLYEYVFPNLKLLTLFPGIGSSPSIKVKCLSAENGYNHIIHLSTSIGNKICSRYLKIGWTSIFEWNSFQTYLGQFHKEMEKLTVFKPLIREEHKNEENFIRIGLGLSAIVNKSQKQNPWGINNIKQILNDLHILKNTIPNSHTSTHHLINNYRLYLPDYRVGLREIELVQNKSYTFICKESLSIDSGELFCLSNNFILKGITRKGEVAFVNVVPENKGIYKKLILFFKNRSISLRILLKGDKEGNEAVSRDILFREFHFDPIAKEETFNKLLKRLNGKSLPWKNYGCLPNQIPTGIGHGNLTIKQIFEIQEKEESQNIPQIISYDYFNTNHPLLKDHASLEASLWLDYLPHEMESIEILGETFVQLLISTKIEEFRIPNTIQLDSSKNFLIQITLIREKALQLYVERGFSKRFFNDYFSLLYNELLVQSSHPYNSKKPNQNHVVNILFIICILNEIIICPKISE